VGARRFLALWECVRVGVVPCWNKHVWRRKPKNLHAKSQISSSYSFRDLSVHTDRPTVCHRRTWLDRLGEWSWSCTYTLWGRKRFHLSVTHLSTNLAYPFTRNHK